MSNLCKELPRPTAACRSDAALREDADDGHLDVLLLEVLLVTLADEVERHEGQ